MLAIGSTGVVMWIRLPPGSGHDATVLSLGRHDWGDLHAWLAVALGATLLTHLALHWKWIASVTAGQVERARRRRVTAALLALAAAVGLAAGPLVAPIVSVAERGRGDLPFHGHGHGAAPAAEALTGRDTLGVAAERLHLPTAEVARRLGLDPATAADTRLGPAARRQGVTMEHFRALLAPDGGAP